MTAYLLCDNGSTKPEATIQLRQIAEQLSELYGETVYPVSLMHANKIPASLIDNNQATIFPDFLDQQLSAGERNFIVIPLFFGTSRALTSYIPEKTQNAVEKHGFFSLSVRDVLYPLPQGEPALVNILISHIQATAGDNNLSLNNIVLVDHGSPIPQVTAVRTHIAQAIQQASDLDIDLEQCVMERRMGKEYDFNGPLLEDWLTKKAESGESSAIVLLLFLLPGKHAGPGGDIVEICQSVTDRFPDFKIAISPLISNHPGFIDILLQRLKSSQDIA